MLYLCHFYLPMHLSPNFSTFSLNIFLLWNPLSLKKKKINPKHEQLGSVFPLSFLLCWNSRSVTLILFIGRIQIHVYFLSIYHLHV